MEIKYLGHSSFKVRGKTGGVVTDPFDPKVVGVDFPRVSAEVVTVSHDHDDHNQVQRVGGTANRKEPFVISGLGEYEVSGVGVIGVRSWHDDKKGSERGENLIFVMQIDGVIVAHLGDLGHVLSDKQVANIGSVDVVLLPVGGLYTIGAGEAVRVVEQLSPAVVVPMHYRMEKSGEIFKELATVEEFLERADYGGVRREEKLSLTKTSLPEETEVVVLEV